MPAAARETARQRMIRRGAGMREEGLRGEKTRQPPYRARKKPAARGGGEDVKGSERFRA
jgi:hypothetical protein